MSLQQLSRSPELQRLRDENFDVTFLGDHLVLRNVPYVTEQRVIARGMLIVAQLNLAGDVVAKPENHEMLWVGDLPRGLNDQPLALGARGVSVTIADGVTATWRFSHKNPNRPYGDYHEMFMFYHTTIAGPAEAIEPSLATRLTPPYVPDERESVFNYLDTATSRAGIPDATRRLELESVAIVGLGGTGSYILDGIAKVPIRNIHVYDGDKFLTHNAFRSPGAPSLDELKLGSYKAEYFAQRYSAMHRNIIPHNEAITEHNIEVLRAMNFVFMAVDSGPSRRLLVDRLQEWRVPFVDVGMGLLANQDVKISGLLRTTASVPDMPSICDSYMDFEEGKDDLYKRNIQTADLNMLNAALALVKFKKIMNFYFDDEFELHSNYAVSGNAMVNEGPQ